MLRKVATFLLSYPMKCVERCHFVDVVSGASVGIYEDRFGRQWLAEGRFSLFRVERQIYFGECGNAE